MKKWKVVVDIAPNTIQGTNGCHKYVFGEYKTKKEATATMEEINGTRGAGMAFVTK